MTKHTAYRGDTFSLILPFTVNGQPYDLTGAKIYFTVKPDYEDLTDSTALLAKTSGDGITTTNAVGGLALLEIPAADVDQMPVQQKLIYDVQVRDIMGRIFTTELGNLTFLPEITRSVA